MSIPFSSLIIAEQAAEVAAPTGGGMSQILIMGLLFAGMWFLMIAPQRKKQKAHQKMVQALGSGDDVVTTGGVFGTITNVKSDRYVLRIAEGTKIEIMKSAIQTRVVSGPSA